MKILKKLLGFFEEEKFKDEMDDFDIVNGKLIKKGNYIESTKFEDKKNNESLLESKEVLRDDNVRVKNESKNKNEETKFYEEIIQDRKLDTNDLEKEEYEGLQDLRRKKGRTRDIQGFYVFLQSAGRGKLTIKGSRPRTGQKLS